MKTTDVLAPCQYILPEKTASGQRLTGVHPAGKECCGKLVLALVKTRAVLEAGNQYILLVEPELCRLAVSTSCW